MRRLIVLLFLIAAPAAHADPVLFGRTTGDGPLRLLNADLEPIRGSAAIPRSVAESVLSPDGRFFASAENDNLVIRSARTARGKVFRLKHGVAPVAWIRGRIIALGGDKNGRKQIKTYDAKTGRATLTSIPGTVYDYEAAGRHARLAVRQGDTAYVRRIRPDGTTARNTAIPTPGAVAQNVEIDGGTVIVGAQDAQGQNVQFLGRAGRTSKLLPADRFWATVGPDFVTDGEMVHRVDPDTLALGQSIPLEGYGLTPFRDGFILGFGAARYNADLERVATHSDPLAAESAEFGRPVEEGPIVAGNRLYGRVDDCESAATVAFVSDARTGELRERVELEPGAIVGVVGRGLLNGENDDICD